MANSFGRAVQRAQSRVQEANQRAAYRREAAADAARYREAVQRAAAPARERERAAKARDAAALRDWRPKRGAEVFRGHAKVVEAAAARRWQSMLVDVVTYADGTQRVVVIGQIPLTDTKAEARAPLAELARRAAQSGKGKPQPQPKDAPKGVAEVRRVRKEVFVPLWSPPPVAELPAKPVRKGGAAVAMPAAKGPVWTDAGPVIDRPMFDDDDGGET